MFKNLFSSDDSVVNSKVATIMIVLMIIVVMVFSNIVTTIIASIPVFVVDPQVLWVLAGIIIGALGADGLSALTKK